MDNSKLEKEGSISPQSSSQTWTRRWWKIAWYGLFISFLGTLPLGTLNIAAMQISVSKGVLPAVLFSLGALLVEIIYVRISLVAMDWVRRQARLFKWLDWITLFVVLSLAFASYYAALSGKSEPNVVLTSSIPAFWLGITLSAINPVQIPFWFGWSTVLFTKQILVPQKKAYNLYILGIGIGTFIGNSVFIFGGKWIVEKLNTNQQTLNVVVGSVFMLTAVLQSVKMINNRNKSIPAP